MKIFKFQKIHLRLLFWFVLLALVPYEDIDGTGYPRGLKDNNILTEAQIIRIADIIEAMSSHRPYRPAPGLDAAIEELLKNREKKYNADIVDICIKVFREGRFKFKS